MAHRPLILGCLALAGLTGCLAITPTGRLPHGGAAASAKPTPDASPAIAATLAPTASPSASPAVAPPAAGFGRVLGLDGHGAAGIPVRAFVADELITENGAGVIANNGGNIVANNGGGLRLLSTAQATATTGPDGSFQLPVDPQGRALNLEAVQADDVKAIALRVVTGAAGLTLQLAHTGSISGRVTASGAGTVYDFLGVDVYVPGTSYIAKTDASGNYTIANMPAGTFSLVASKPGLGQGNASGVAVASDKVTQAPDIDLHVDPPVIAAVTPDAAGPGATITVTGDHFGASNGGTFEVAFGGGKASLPERPDDHTIRFKLPLNATTGDVTVSVAGIQSNARSLKVLKKLYLPRDLDVLRVGEKFAATVYGRDTADALFPVTAVDWAASGAATVAAPPTVVGQAAGDGEVDVRSGSIVAAQPIKVYADTIVMRTLAGGQPRELVDGPGSEARFKGPGSLIVGPDGTVYISDYDDAGARLRTISPGNLVSILAGGGPVGTPDGDGVAVRLGGVTPLRFDAQGNLLGLDRSTGNTRMVTPAGHVSTIPTRYDATAIARLGKANALVSDADGNLFFAGNDVAGIWKLTPDGTLSAFATIPGLVTDNYARHGLAFDAKGQLYYTQTKSNQVWRIAPTGEVTVLAGSGTAGATDGHGTTASFTAPGSLAVSASGNVYVFEYFKAWDTSVETRIRRISPEGDVTTLADGHGGTLDGPFGVANYWTPYSPVFAPNGDLVFIDLEDYTAAVRRVSGLP